jgi:hypothetical protein
MLRLCRPDVGREVSLHDLARRLLPRGDCSLPEDFPEARDQSLRTHRRARETNQTHEIKKLVRVFESDGNAGQGKVVLLLMVARGALRDERRHGRRTKSNDSSLAATNRECRRRSGSPFCVVLFVGVRWLDDVAF